MSERTFGDIYRQRDPRSYFRCMQLLDYQVGYHSPQVFGGLLRGVRELRRQAKVLDIGCAYGTNAALLNCAVTWDDLCARYEAPRAQHLSPEELLTLDRTFFAVRRKRNAQHLVGLDVFGDAVDYALKVDLLDAGFVEDLDAAPASAELSAAIAGVNLIMVSGNAACFSPKTYQRVLEQTVVQPWVGALVTRGVDYRPVTEVMADYGLVTERLSGQTFPQRRFTNEEECRSTLEKLTDLGISVAGREAAGYLHAELYVSRPSGEAEILPLDTLLDSSPLYP